MMGRGGGDVGRGRQWEGGGGGAATHNTTHTTALGATTHMFRHGVWGMI